jgi:hypothetical protein
MRVELANRPKSASKQGGADAVILSREVTASGGGCRSDLPGRPAAAGSPYSAICGRARAPTVLAGPGLSGYTAAPVGPALPDGAAAVVGTVCPHLATWSARPVGTPISRRPRRAIAQAGTALRLLRRSDARGRASGPSILRPSTAAGGLDATPLALESRRGTRALLVFPDGRRSRPPIFAPRNMMRCDGSRDPRISY